VRALAAAAALLAGLVPVTTSHAEVASHDGPGTLVTSTPLPAELSLPGAATALRISYTSTGFDGRPTVVTGAVFVPPGAAPKHGWPVLAWAHGTVGIADVCAPSANPRSARDSAYLSAWLDAGYAVVSTDYEGLGTPGPHQYLNGRSEAFGTIDSVRAARQLHLDLGRRWLAAGQSQGAQAVLFTGPLAPTYAPELDLRGVVSTAPISQWRMTLDAVKPFLPDRPASPFVIPILAGVEAAHARTFDPADYLTPFGEQLLADVRTTDCFTALAVKTAGHLSQEVYDASPAEVERMMGFLEQDSEVPITQHRRPIFLAQGLADTVVYPAATMATADKLRAAGNDVTLRTYPGADHNGVMAAALPEILAWSADRMAGH
jgi:hypothetical protein